MDFIPGTAFTIIATAVGIFIGIVILIVVRNMGHMPDDTVPGPPRKKVIGEYGWVTIVFVIAGLAMGLYTKRITHWLSTGFWVGFAVAAALKSIHTVAEARDANTDTSQESVRRYGKKHRIV